jgi:hypothetical protein
MQLISSFCEIKRNESILLQQSTGDQSDHSSYKLFDRNSEGEQVIDNFESSGSSFDMFDS